MATVIDPKGKTIEQEAHAFRQAVEDIDNEIVKLDADIVSFQNYAKAHQRQQTPSDNLQAQTCRETAEKLTLKRQGLTHALRMIKERIEAPLN